MKTKRFISAWLASAVLMFGVSYLWHGLILNDLVHVNYEPLVFFGLLIVVYVAIGLILTYLYQYMYVKELKYKGVTIGAVLGFFIYLIAFVLGVSFNGGSLKYVAVDFLWQMLEQGAGGAAVGFLFSLFEEIEKLAKAENQ